MGAEGLHTAPWRRSRHLASLALWSPELCPHSGQLGPEGLREPSPGFWEQNDATLEMCTVLEPPREIPGRTKEMTASPNPLTGTPSPSLGWAPQNGQGSIRGLCRGRRSRQAATRASQRVGDSLCCVTRPCAQTSTWCAPGARPRQALGRQHSAGLLFSVQLY